MHNIKIAFFDIDGTLIDMHKKEISQNIIYTLKELQAKGIIICIATGRTPMTIPKFDDIQFDAYLACNGVYCFNEKEKIYSNPITAKDIKTLLQNAAEMNRPVSVATLDRVAANGSDAELKEYYGFAKLELEVARSRH